MSFKRILYLFILIFLLAPQTSQGMMSSTNYTIFADSVEAGGGAFSSGGAYTLEDTTGGTPAGFATSSVYEVRGGYQAMDWSTLTMSVSTSSLDLGNLDATSVKTGGTTITITADAETGYILAIAGVSGSHLLDVTDGSVTAGSEEYGIAVSGTDALFADDRAIAAGLNLSSSSTPVTNAQSVLTFKAAMVGPTPAGARSQGVTLSVSTNF